MLIVIGLAVVVIPRVANLGAFIVFDEPLYWPWANQFFKAIMAGDWANTLLGRGNPGITVVVIQCLGLAARYLLNILTGATPAQALAHLHLESDTIVFGDLTARRLPMALLNIACMLWLIFLVYRQFGQKIAVVAAILLGLDAFLLSDSRTMRGDAMMSVLMTISAITLLIYLAEGQWRYLWLSGLAAAVSFANKFSMLAMAPFVVLLVGTFVFQQARQVGWRRNLGAGLRCLLVWGGLSPLILWLMWPALWVIPAEVLAFVGQFAAGASFEGRNTFFMGQVYTNQLLLQFYVVLILLRISALTFIGGLAGLFSLWSPVRRQALAQPWLAGTISLDRTSPGIRAMMTIGTLALYSVSVWLIMTIGVLKRDHYVMPVFPALDILGAVGLVWLVTRLADYLSWRWPAWSSERVSWSAFALIFAFQSTISLPHHPYYYSYYNPLILGPLWAHRVTMINWGPDMGEAARYLNTLDRAESLKVASATVDKFIPEFKGTTIRFVYGQPWIQADYIVIPYEDVQFPKINPPYYAYAVCQPLVYQMILGGVPFGWIYRGPAAQHYAGSKLDGLGILLGYNLAKEPTPAGSTTPIKLFWQNDGRSSDDGLWVRLVSADGYVWAENLAQPLPDFAQAALTDKAVAESRVNLAIPLGTPPGVYFLKMDFQSAGTGEVLGTFKLPSDGDKLTVTRPAGPVSLASLPIDHTLDQAIAPKITLLGYSLPDNLLTQSDANRLTLFWRAEAKIAQDYVMALQLLERQGQEATYWLGRPVMSGYPTQEWTAGEIVRDPWQLKLPANVSPGVYTLQLTLFDAVTQAKVKQITLGEVSVVERRRQFAVPPMQQTVNANLANQVTLLGYDLLSKPITGGGRLRVTLYWRAGQTIPADYTVFTQLLGPDGVVAGQHDGVPAEGRLPTTTWQVGEIIPDRHQIDYPTAQKGEYRLIVGMYDPITGARLPVADSAGAPVGDFLWLYTFKIQ
ncbi:MAG: glycosyltransferase family 39 protein [Chloroflexi bacterium]|nr:glycosyltransferase family 39 protein [Chloroflexota bacterium]